MSSCTNKANFSCVPSGHSSKTIIPAFELGHFAALCLAAMLCGCAGHHPVSTTEYREVYDRPLLSPGAQFAALPPAVQNTIRAEVGGTELLEVFKDTSSSPAVYRVDFENRDLFPPMYIAADGSLLDPDLSVAIAAPKPATPVIAGGPVTLSLNDLPPAAVKTIQHAAPDAEVASITKQTKGDQTTYTVTFKDRAHPALYIGTDGTLLPAQAH
jgi:hypothetical protein